MRKYELLSASAYAYSEWKGALAVVGQSEMLTSGVAGEWSVKDLIAHVTWSVNETVGMLDAKALVGSELWRLPEDQRNLAVYDLNRDRSLEDVLIEFESTHQRLLDLLQAIPEDDLLHASWFADLPGGEWPPWRVVMVNVIDHYRHHTGDIASWLERQNSKS